MSTERDFVAALAGASKNCTEIQNTMKATYGDQSLKKTAIYDIWKKVKVGETTKDQHHQNSKNNKVVSWHHCRRHRRYRGGRPHDHPAAVSSNRSHYWDLEDLGL